MLRVCLPLLLPLLSLCNALCTNELELLTFVCLRQRDHFVRMVWLMHGAGEVDAGLEVLLHD